MKTHRFTEILKAHHIEPKVIYDIGAFDGAQSLELSAAFPEASIFAFEPVPENVALCQVNVFANPKIEVWPIALGDKESPVTFNQSLSANKECGSVLQPNGEYPEAMPMRKIIVPMRRIETLPLPNPDVIWMDVQGLELDVLKGMGWRLRELKAFWAEITFRAYYHGQMLSDEFTKAVEGLGFRKVHEEVGLAGWFGDAAYVQI